jgi:hypothetical protein
VLTLRCARTKLRSACRSRRFAACLAAAAALSAPLSPSARADGVAIGGCVGSRYSVACVTRWGAYSDPYVRLVPPQTDVEKALSADRERRWQSRCRPVVFQDAYGVLRYEYAASGCEFGVVE